MSSFCFGKRPFLMLLSLIPILSWGQSEITLSTVKPIGEKLFFYLVSSDDLQIEGVEGEVVSSDWSEVVVQSPTIKIRGGVTIANLTRCDLVKVDLSSCPHIQEISLSYNKIKQLTLGSQPDLSSIKVAGNHLSEDQMLSLVKALPDRTNTTRGVLYAKDCVDTEDFNVLTPEMLREAKARHWQIQVCIYSEEEKRDKWIEYDGANLSSLETPRTQETWQVLFYGDCLRVEGADAPLHIQVYSMTGDLVYERLLGQECSLEGLPKGCYLVCLSDREKTTAQKVLKL